MWSACFGIALLSAGLALADDAGSSAAKKVPGVVAGSCATVAEGKVGESGVSAFLHHQVTGKRPVIMVLRTVGSSLCPDTGAVAVLVINGKPVAHGSLTAAKSALHVQARPGDHVCAIVHTVPLFNGIACIRLGDLRFALQQCKTR